MLYGVIAGECILLPLFFDKQGIWVPIVWMESFRVFMIMFDVCFGLDLTLRSEA